jgi:hypothetical protein
LPYSRARTGIADFLAVPSETGDYVAFADHEAALEALRESHKALEEALRWREIDKEPPPPWDVNPYNSGTIHLLRWDGEQEIGVYWFPRNSYERKRPRPTHWKPLCPPPDTAMAQAAELEGK